MKNIVYHPRSSFHSRVRGHWSSAGAAWDRQPSKALVCPEVENIRTLQSHEFWEGSYQNQHPALAFLLSGLIWKANGRREEEQVSEAWEQRNRGTFLDHFGRQ